jgi:predicted DNA-binding transcriptional regulator AlpA
MAMEPLMKPEDIASAMQISTRHFAERISHQPGFPRPIMVGSRRRWLKRDIERWLEGRRATTR